MQTERFQNETETSEFNKSRKEEHLRYGKRVIIISKDALEAEIIASNCWFLSHVEEFTPIVGMEFSAR